MKINAFAPPALFLSGGPESVTRHVHTARTGSLCFNWAVLCLGICYGMQTMAEQLGGSGSRQKVNLVMLQMREQKFQRLLKDIEDHVIAEG